jgi:exodeoxyribonuclease VII small subunit
MTDATAHDAAPGDGRPDDTGPDDTGPDRAPDGTGPGYAEALAELEAILVSLENADLDVDVLGAKVARAAELIRHCRTRIGAARLEVEQVVAEFED